MPPVCAVGGEWPVPAGRYRHCEKHADWVETFRYQYTFTEENVEDILQQEIGKVFVKVLEDAGVYKCTEEGRKAFDRFIASL